jgi:hypothetical protein
MSSKRCEHVRKGVAELATVRRPRCEAVVYRWPLEIRPVIETLTDAW